MNTSNTNELSRRHRKRQLVAQHNAGLQSHDTSVLTRNEREELNALSKEVFGASSRWQKLVVNGYRKIATKKQEETIPGEKEGDAPTTRTVDVPVELGKNSYAFTNERYTVAGIKKYMTERKELLATLKANFEKQQAEAKAKKEQEELLNKVANAATGSAK